MNTLPISKKQRDSLKKALLGCAAWTKEGDVYSGEAHGWKMLLAKENGAFKGYALHDRFAVHLFLPARVAQFYYERISDGGQRWT